MIFTGKYGNMDFKIKITYPGAEVENNYGIYNTTLIYIEGRIISMGGEQLPTYGLPQCNRTDLNNLVTELVRETSYDVNVLAKYINENKSKLLCDQGNVYTKINEHVRCRSGCIYFLDAPGGTGKTFVINLI